MCLSEALDNHVLTMTYNRPPIKEASLDFIRRLSVSKGMFLDSCCDM